MRTAVQRARAAPDARCRPCTWLKAGTFVAANQASRLPPCPHGVGLEGTTLSPVEAGEAVHGRLGWWRGADDKERLLRYVQPGLIGLIDGTISTLAPMFAAAYLAGSRAALLVGLSAALGAAISMGMSEALSDDGELTGRGDSTLRGLITGGATFVGGAFHALPFLLADVNVALAIAYVVVSVELVAIAFIRKRYLQVSLTRSLIQVTLGGVIVSAVGIFVGHA